MEDPSKGTPSELREHGYATFGSVEMADSLGRVLWTICQTLTQLAPDVPFRRPAEGKLL